MPTITLRRHLPLSEVNCGFTYIGVLFNFLTLKKKREVPRTFKKNKIWEYHEVKSNTHKYIFVQSDFSNNGLRS